MPILAINTPARVCGAPNPASAQGLNWMRHIAVRNELGGLCPIYKREEKHYDNGQTT